LRVWEAIDLERVLLLHFAERLSQARIGALYVGASLIVAISAGASGGMGPQPFQLPWSHSP
jgi:hypothetical protein